MALEMLFKSGLFAKAFTTGVALERLLLEMIIWIHFN